MLTVRNVATAYGTTAAFVVQAFGRLGFVGLTPESPVTDGAVNAFEKAYGAKARAARAEGAGTADAGSPRKPRRHVMRIAHAQITGRRLYGFF